MISTVYEAHIVYCSCCIFLQRRPDQLIGSVNDLNFSTWYSVFTVTLYFCLLVNEILAEHKLIYCILVLILVIILKIGKIFLSGGRTGV